MNVIEAIKARRSVRSFEPLAVRSTDITMLLDAAIHAPSALNAQPWSFAVVQDRERLQRFSDGVKRLTLANVAHDPKTGHYESLLRSESFNVFHGAATLIAISVVQPGVYGDAAAWVAAENLMLAAHAIGLGTCCVGMALPFLNTAEAKAELAVPSTARVVVAIVVGHPSDCQLPPARSAPSISCWLRDAAHRAT